ncbi:MAG: phosphate ABC transporter substrate-binding protein PstS family protein [Oscillospiraceae bacterium]|nr:phosphate ABC transporter substrate-binding protein PstS family protein [Oscillospiraceae bacterium]
MIKKIFALILVISMIIVIIPAVTVYAADTVTLTIDGVKQNPKVDPVVENKTAYVPVKFVAETLGGTYSFNKTKKEATVQMAANKVVFTVDSKTYTLNGATRTLANPVKSIDGNIMAPAAAFEAIGAKVSYNASTKAATINYFSTMTGTIKVSGSTTVQPIAQAAADKLMKMNKDLSITVSGGGSGTGINDAVAGTVNIGMSSREFREAEMKTLNTYAVANDAIAIIVHPDNPITNLTKEQAQKIFTGEIKNWKDVGGGNAPILVQTRETGSGTLTTLIDLLLGSGKSVVETATPFTSSTLIKQAVAKDKNAIGFDSIGFVDKTVKAVSLDGKSATPKTVINKTYGMGRSLYVCTKGKAAGVNAMFIDYLKSADCQNSIVEKEGYVKLY